MIRSGADVAELLRALADSGDDWLRVWETDDGQFRVSDPTGSIAAIEIEPHWVEVRAGRPMNTGPWVIGKEARPGHSLLRLHVSHNAPAMVIVCGRVYLDGFTLHALMCTARDVLSVAGPLLPEPERAAAFDVEAPEFGTVEASADHGPRDEGCESKPAADEPDLRQPPFPIADATVISPEPAASLPIEATQAPSGEPSPVESIESGEADVAPDPNAESRSSVPATPIVPTWASSVGATVQIPRIPKTESVPRTESDATPRDVEPALEAAAPASCHRCGEEVQPGERFCINCGAAQETVPPSSVEQTVARRSEPDTVIWRRPQPGDNQCARCGGANPESNRYCQSCGATLRDG